MEQAKEIELLLILISLSFLIIIAFIIGLFIYIKRKKTQYLINKERLESNFQKILLSSKMEISEEILKQVAWELHDNIGQILSMASLHLNIIINKNTAKDKELLEVSNMLKDSIDQIRKVSRTLNRDIINEIDFNQLVKQELERTKKVGIKNISFTNEKNISFTLEQKLIIFRIIQELIVNVLKHAQADSIDISLHSEGKFSIIKITDNGIGFELKSIKLGNGLINVKQRIQFLNGSYTIKSAPGLGTTFSLSIPEIHNQLYSSPSQPNTNV